MQTIFFIIFWDLLKFSQIFLSSLVKRWAIVTYKDGIYELSHELPNDLRLRILRNLEILGNCLNFTEWWPSPQSSSQYENFVNTSRKLLGNKNETFPVVHYFTWKLELVSDFFWVIFSETFFLILTCPRPLQT